MTESRTFTVQVNGRALQITVADVTCAHPGCSEPRRTPRARYCAGHDTSTARMAARRERQRG